MSTKRHQKNGTRKFDISEWCRGRSVPQPGLHRPQHLRSHSRCKASSGELHEKVWNRLYDRQTGGLKNEPPSGNIVLAKEVRIELSVNERIVCSYPDVINPFAFDSQDTLFKGSVSRDVVAKVAVDSLSIPAASYKVVELVSEPDAPAKSIPELFEQLR